MRIYKNAKKQSKTELKHEISQLKQEGWRPGPVRVNIDSMHPYQCQLYKDLSQASGGIDLR